MYLIDKENRLPAIHPAIVFGSRHNLFHILLAGGCGVNLHKLRAGGIGNHLGKRGFTGARRSV